MQQPHFSGHKQVDRSVCAVVEDLQGNMARESGRSWLVVAQNAENFLPKQQVHVHEEHTSTQALVVHRCAQAHHSGGAETVARAIHWRDRKLRLGDHYVYCSLLGLSLGHRSPVVEGSTAGEQGPDTCLLLVENDLERMAHPLVDCEHNDREKDDNQTVEL